MENEQKKLVLLAEDVLISEESKLNPIFLTVDVKLCDSVVNANREGVTEAFIADVVNRANDHLCLPFYADVKNLLAENYEQLGHLYNRVTRKFGTNMIGSISDFYSSTDENGVVSLYGKIKIPKRDRDIIYRLVDLYEMGRFAVSVELSYDPRELIIAEDGKFIDASENSALTGLCLVWRPACTDAYALDMVAEAADDSEEIVTESEELTAERGENEPMEKEKKLAAEVTDETATETEEKKVAVAEGEGASGEGASESGEGASESGEGASESGEGASESGEGASESGGGSGGSEGGSDDEGGGDDAGEGGMAPIIDPDETIKNLSVSETDEANAEVLEHSVDTHESVEICPYSGEPVHVIEYHERIIETLEDAGDLIAELDAKVAELEEIKIKYDAIIAEAQEKALAEKKAQAKAFAEKQGLDVADAMVAEAIENLDYTKIAELTMAQAQDEEPAHEETKPAITLASFVELEISDDKYGGLLNRRNK